MTLVPSSEKTLRACISCSLVLDSHQFFENGCPNCLFLHLKDNETRVIDCTTDSFEGYLLKPFLIPTIRFYSLIHPKQSWIGSQQHTSHLKPGCYAIHVGGHFPDHILEELSDGNISLINRDMRAEKESLQHDEEVKSPPESPQSPNEQNLNDSSSLVVSARQKRDREE